MKPKIHKICKRSQYK